MIQRESRLVIADNTAAHNLDNQNFTGASVISNN